MIAKKRLFPILMAILMVFAMMPMTAGTVFADDGTVYTVTVEPGEGTGTAFTVQSTTILPQSDVISGNYDGKKGCFLRYDGEDAIYYRFPTECPFTAPDGKEFDCWKCSTGGSLDAGTFIPIAEYGNITITALWKGSDTDPHVTLSLPETVNVRYGDTQTAFDISVTEALFPDDIDDFEVRLKDSSFTCTSHDGTIPFIVTTNAAGVPYGYDGDEWCFDILRNTSLPFNCQGFININNEDWAAAKPGTYTATLKVRTVPSLCEDKEITLTLVVPDPATVHSVTVNNGTGSGRYVEGESVTITANEPESGKQFKEWTDVDGLTFTSGSATSSTATFTMPANDVTVTATYEDIPAPPVEKYTVTFDANGGSGSIDPAVISAGEEFTVPECTFIPPEGKVFQRWNTLPVGTTGNYGTWYDPGDKITLTEDMTLYARWSEPMLSICSYDMTQQESMRGGQFTSIYGGSLSPGCNNYTVQFGDEYSVTAVPDDGYEFIGWYKGEYINEDAQGNPIQDARPYLNEDNLLTNDLTYTFKINGNTVLCPVFKKAEKEPEPEPQPAAQMITASNVTRTYGDAAFSLGAKTNGDGTLTYKSSNTKVATVSSAGKVTIKGAGTAKITISASATANYKAATKTITVTINKAKNPLTIKAKTATVKYKKLKKKTQTLAVTRVIEFTKKLNDKKTYTLVSAKKGSKSFKKYFKINKTTGKVTIKKNKKMKKGTYKVKVKIQALGNSNYKASAVKTVTFKVKVK